MSEYAELHASSAFSFLRGAAQPEHLAQTAAVLELPAIALCDRNGLYGAARLKMKADEAGIAPIVGCELTMEDGGIVPVLVETRTGYHNLCALLSEAHLRTAKGQCSIGWTELAAHSEGLLALTGGTDGPLVQALRQR